MKDRTTILICGGEPFRQETYEILYSKYSKFVDLPSICQQKDIKKEFERYHLVMNWYKKSVRIKKSVRVKND
jgi:hypothetical protein